jgi:acetoin utilization protein AcuB
MRIDAWMTRTVKTVKPMDSLARAREIMVENRINQLPVVAMGKLAGIVTDRDLRDAYPSALAGGQHSTLEDAQVESVMTVNVLTLGPEDPLMRAAELMRNERIGAVPVVEKDHLVGIVTRSDILRAFVALSKAEATANTSA